MKHAEQVRNRIETKGTRAEDIKHKGRLSISEIDSIPESNVFMWIRAGDWKMKDFNKWLEAKKYTWLLDCHQE